MKQPLCGAWQGWTARGEPQSHLTCHFGSLASLLETGRDRENLYFSHIQSPSPGGALPCTQHLSYPLEFLEVSYLILTMAHGGEEFREAFWHPLFGSKKKHQPQGKGPGIHSFENYLFCLCSFARERDAAANRLGHGHKLSCWYYRLKVICSHWLGLLASVIGPRFKDWDQER